ncbi:hypothetical protein TNCV_2812611 [Trichonephila clavipes]|nr:hypothetical protein TNCV_2812611 [Trichonephila clavipes]
MFNILRVLPTRPTTAMTAGHLPSMDGDYRGDFWKYNSSIQRVLSPRSGKLGQHVAHSRASRSSTYFIFKEVLPKTSCLISGINLH